MEAWSRKHKIPVMPQITVNVDTLNVPTTGQGSLERVAASAYKWPGKVLMKEI